MTTPAPVALCGAKKRQGDGTCTQVAGWATDHVGWGRCKFHGGNTPNQRSAARAAQVESEARKVLAELDVQPVADPFTELARVAGQIRAWQNVLADKVNALGDRIRYEGAGGTEQIRAEIQLYERAMDRNVHVLTSIARLNIEDRMARVTERQADVVVAAIEAALAAAGVTGQQAAEARRAAARHLRAVPS